MPTQLSRLPRETPRPSPPAVPASRALYFDLLDPGRSARARDLAGDYLREQLRNAANLPCDLPDDPAGLPAWVGHSSAAVGRRYQAYLDERQAGAPRRYFAGRAHARHFLRGVAPTKLVDGAWLYGLVPHWRDARFTSLIQTYLEELGEGLPEKNHVVLYRELLASQGCEDWQRLDDTHFVQGAIQLALAEQAEHFLPEVIGFNLGYEQLPLHLLISAYELAELGIDPYYFTLHVTVDNAHSGHAHKAVTALREAWPQLGDDAAFWRRVRNGYRLNDLGASTLSVIDGFDAETEVIRVLAEKSDLGRYLHSDYCRFDGRTVNQWLADPASIPAFLDQLQRRGWIRRHRDPGESRFWQLIEGERAPMFGVFSAYERALIHDWIAGDRLAELPSKRGALVRRLATQTRPGQADATRPAGDFAEEERLLQQALARLPNRAARLQHLLPLLAPARHHSAAGLAATRLFSALFNRSDMDG